MRIRSIKISRWRHFENISLSLNPDAGLVCIVGANGTGKSHLLELIAACAHRLGLSQGTELPRGDPFRDEHDFELEFYVAPEVSSAVDELTINPEILTWDRTLKIVSRKLPDAEETRIYAGGSDYKNHQESFARAVISALNQSKDVHFVSLDADRSYPKKNIQTHEIGQIYDIDWEASEYTRGRSFKSTATLYDEWIKYFLAQENQAGTQLMAANRRAQEAGTAQPAFLDHFLSYKQALRKVLPHLVFAGVNSKKRQILFDATGMELAFDQLSGGEREIAFLVGQIERFQLRHGLFLLDEPELHLNSDLIRSWVAYLTSTVSSGQIWLATHSLEAVEAAGQHSTFILEKDPETRRVSSVARLDDRPVLSALARAVGTPAFSISQLRFVFVEGEPGVGERERFKDLTEATIDFRFMDCGSSSEVIKRVGTVRALSNEEEGHIRIGGVVDRDFKNTNDTHKLTEELGIFVLPIHEIENYFLHPETLRALLEQNGLGHITPLDLIRNASDARAGSWIFQYAMSATPAKKLPAMPEAAKDAAKRLAWNQFNNKRHETIAEIVTKSNFEPDKASSFSTLLNIAANAYNTKRADNEIWKYCEGKQVLSAIATSVGFSDKNTLSQASYALWKRDPSKLPAELIALRLYIQGL